jgi:hypothetical protein
MYDGSLYIYLLIAICFVYGGNIRQLIQATHFNTNQRVNTCQCTDPQRAIMNVPIACKWSLRPKHVVAINKYIIQVDGCL